MIAIVDYGVGNLFSLECSLKKIGAESIVTGDPELIAGADKIILPGVGAFSDAIAKLRESGLADLLISLAKSGKKIMGICLGMQLLFEESEEYGRHAGLGLLSGRVVPILREETKHLKIPQMGYNSLKIEKNHPILNNTREGDFVYFVHSFCAEGCSDSLIASTDYGITVTAAVGKDNVAGTQFHPEKSGEAGLNILRAFAEW